MRNEHAEDCLQGIIVRGSKHAGSKRVREEQTSRKRPAGYMSLGEHKLFRDQKCKELLRKGTSVQRKNGKDQALREGPVRNNCARGLTCWERTCTDNLQ